MVKKTISAMKKGQHKIKKNGKQNSGQKAEMK